KEMETGLAFGEVFKRRGKLPGLSPVEADGANVLATTPNHLSLFFAAALRKDVEGGTGCRDRQQSDEENDQENCVTVLRGCAGKAKLAASGSLRLHVVDGH